MPDRGASNAKGKKMRILIPTALLIALGLAPAMADIRGMAEVIDSDVIAINKTRVLLYGIDSVERKQICILNGRAWRCYSVAVRELQILTANEPVECKEVAPPDHFGRLFGVCTVGGKNLNEAMVRSGWALARRTETEDYVAAEEAARTEKVGLWQSQFVVPWTWREDNGIEVDWP